MNVLLVTKMKPASGNEEGAWPCAYRALEFESRGPESSCSQVPR